MISDMKTFPDGHQIHADVCIVGSGLAGLTIAHELLHSGLNIALIEAGGTQITRASQSLYRAQISGAPNHATTHSRFRVFGGSGTRWTGQLVPFEAIDLEKRDEIAHSGWPITAAEMQPYYERADEIFGLRPRGHELQHWPVQDSFAHPIANEQLHESMIRFAHPRDLGALMKPDLESSETLTVYLNANLVQIHTRDAGESVTHLELVNSLGYRSSVRAARYVLACGGIENPRLLLASNQHDSHALGNRHDQLGRYFMDHPYLTTAVWEPGTPATAESLHVIDDYERVARERGAHAVFTLSESIRRDEELNGCVGYFIHREPWQMKASYYQPGGQAVTHAAEVLRRERVADVDLLTSAGNLLSDAPGAVSTLWNALNPRRVRQPCLALRMCVETTPNPDSRITLTKIGTRSGCPRRMLTGVFMIETG